MRTAIGLKNEIRSKTPELMIRLIAMYFDHTSENSLDVFNQLYHIDKDIMFNKYPSYKFIFNNLMAEFDINIEYAIANSQTTVTFDNKEYVVNFIKNYFEWLASELSQYGQISVDTVDNLFHHIFEDYNA